MKVATVVVTYNRKDFLIECLDKIFSQTLKCYLIVIVDNNSTDGTDNLLIERGILQSFREIIGSKTSRSYYKGTKIFYIKLKQNLGGAGGFHYGLKLANSTKPDYIWIMDDDSEPMEDTLENLVSFANRYPNSILCPIIVHKYSGLVESYHHKKINRLNGLESPLIYSNDIKEFSKSDPYRIEANAFVGILIDRRIVKKIGFPVKEIFIWGDDTEYTYRAFRHGFDVYLVSSIVIYHKDAFLKTNVSSKNTSKRLYYLVRNRVFFILNYADIPILGILRTIVRIIKEFFSEFKLSFLLSKIRGLIDGVILWAKIKHKYPFKPKPEKV